RLVEEADPPKLTPPIFPPAPQHSVFGGSFFIFRFGEEADAVLQEGVGTQNPRSGFSLEGGGGTDPHRIAFQMLVDAALDPVASRKLILETAEGYWSGA